jgi:hypothetical protein
VIALTHYPKLDDLAIMEALKTPAFYVGALGSRRNNAARRERLKEFDLSETELAKLHGPAGIYIGSRTPPEIAVSILAEVTAVKMASCSRGCNGLKGRRRSGRPLKAHPARMRHTTRIELDAACRDSKRGTPGKRHVDCTVYIVRCHK